MNVVLVLDGNSEISAQELLQLFLIASSSSLTLNVSAPKSLYYNNYYCLIFAHYHIINIRFYCRIFTIKVLYNLNSFLNGLYSCHCSMDSFSLYYTNYYCFIFAYYLIITIRFYCRSFTIEVLFNLHSFLNGLFSCHCSMDRFSLLCSAWMICCFCVIIEREIFSLINSMIFNNQVHC